MRLSSKKAFILRKSFALIFIINIAPAYAKLDPKTLIFLTPKIPDSKIENIIEEGSQLIKELDIKSSSTDEKKEYSMRVPVKNDNGIYEFVEVGVKEVGGKRSITIPGKGEISVVKDELGKYSVELTPEQIKGASNITCKLGSSGKGSCTISPYIKIIGNKTLSADKLVVDYTKGENLVIAKGVATNLKLTDKDSVTNFNKSETSAGDTQIAVDFGNKKDSNSKDDPRKISLSTAKMVHTVHNPKNPSESATKFQVKDVGVSANIVFNGDNNTALEMNTATQGGVKYDSNPFSDKKVLIDTTSPANVSFKISNDMTRPTASLTLAIDGKDRDGKVSQTSIVDTKNPDKKSNVTSFGQTYVNLSQEASYDSKTYKITNTDSPVAFEVGSEHLIVKNEKKNGQVTEMEIKGLQTSGTVDSSKKDSKMNITVQELTIKNTKSAKESAEGKTNHTFSAQNLKGAMSENDVVKKQQALVEHAYYNNGETELSLSDSSDLSVSKFKDAKTADKFDDKAVQKDSYILGSKATIKQKESVVVLDGGVAIRQIDFFDKSSLTMVNGFQGDISSKDYDLKLKDGFNFISQSDSKGKNEFTKVAAKQLSAKNGDSNLEMLNSTSSQQIIGKAKDDNDILLIKHTSDGIDYVKGDGAKILNTKQLNVQAVDADLIKYGNASFEKLAYQDSDSKSKVDILGAQLAVYTDESDPTKKIREGNLSASQLNAKGVDYSVDVKAFDEKGTPGKFKIYFFENGKNKSYKIFSEDGKLVEIKGSDKNNKYAQILLETVDYLEDDAFKTILAKNVSGNLKTIDSGDEKLQSFNVGKLYGIQSIDGKFKQFSLTNGAITEVVPNKSFSEVGVKSADYFQKEENGITQTKVTIDGLKASFSKRVNNAVGSADSARLVQVKDKDGTVTQINIKGLNGRGSNEKSAVVLDGFNADAFDSKLIKYGNVSFDQLKYQDKDPKTQREAQITGAKVAIYTDESDPSNKIKQGQMSATALKAKGVDYNIDVKALDDKGVAGDFKVVIFEDGKTKSAKVFTDDGKLLELNGADKNNRHAKVLLETIEYLEADGFKQVLAKNLSGSLKTIEANNDNLQEFKIARLEGVQNLDGSIKQFKLEDGAVIQTKDNVKVDFKSASINQVKNQTSEFSQMDLKGLNAQSSNDKGHVLVSGANAEAFSSKLIKYGNISFDQLKYQDKDPKTKREVEIINATAAIYTNDTDPTNKIKQGELGLAKLNAKAVDYSVDLKVLDDAGNTSKFKVVFFESGTTKNYKIFGENGKLVEVTKLDADNSQTKILLEAVEYLETDKFKQTLATNLSGSLKTVKPDDSKLQLFKFGKLEGLQSLDGSVEDFSIADGVISQSQNGKSDTSFDFKKLNFTQTSRMDIKDIKGEIANGAIKYVEYKDPAKGVGEKIRADLSFGSILVNQVTDASKEKITAISAKNFDLVAVDYEALQKVNAKIGAIDVFETSGMKTIQISDLQKLTIEDLEKGNVIDLKSDEIVRVVNTDKNGKEIGSYLLMNSTFLNATDKKSGVTADVRIGVLEVLQDKLNKQNVILEADVDGKVKLAKGKSPVGAEVAFALKGKNLITDTGSYVSDDKKTVSNYFAIKALDAGRLDNLKLSAGPDFLKEAISIQAKGSKDGGKSLKFSFEQDKDKGTYFIRTEFTEGDKVKVKLFPFTLESKKEGKDAVAELLLTPKGQNYLNHMEIISNVVSAKEITEWLGVSDGGMIVAKTGTVGGFGFEMMYQNQDQFNPQGSTGNSDKASSYGAGIFHKNKKGDKTSAGVLLSGDSEFQYNTNGRGVLKIFGVDMDKDGSIPATINLYVKKEYADGDSIYGGVFVDAASYAVDRDKLNSNASFFEGGRNFGGAGATVAYSKVLSKNSRITFAAGANDDFSNPGVCITYKATLGAVSSLAKSAMEVVNEMEEPKLNYTGLVAASGPSMKGAIALLQDQINELDTKSSDVKALERIKKSLLDITNGIEKKNLEYDKVDNLFTISENDLKTLKKLEDKKMVTRKVASEVRNVASVLKLATFQKSELAQLYQREKDIRDAMEKITQEFEGNSSAEIHQQYLQKVEELTKLKAQ